MSIATRQYGLDGESLATEFLKKKGYRILERNYRTHRGEMDIVAEDAGALVFVEVKARRGNQFGGPHGAVGWRKQQQLIRVASHYMARHRIRNRDCRFDLVLILEDSLQKRQIELIRNAFEVPGC
jgi:putative endonuclease